MLVWPQHGERAGLQARRSSDTGRWQPQPLHLAAQVLVRWGLQHGTAVIPRASSEAHLRSNLGALDWELPQEDFEALSSFEFQVGTSHRVAVLLWAPGLMPPPAPLPDCSPLFGSWYSALGSWVF